MGGSVDEVEAVSTPQDEKRGKEKRVNRVARVFQARWLARG